MSSQRTVAWIAAVALGLSGSAAPLAAQPQELDPGNVSGTRASLRELSDYYANGASSRAYSQELRAEALARAETVQRRLREGDFRVGDRIVLTVEGEPVLNDTFVVRPDLLLELPTLGEISVRGVLRSELTEHMTSQIGRFINNPEVRARSYIRVHVTGAIGTPGFYTMPAATPITEVIMRIGGPTGDANIADLRIFRGEQQLLGGEAGQLAIQQSRTLAELDIQDGDLIVVPRKSFFSPGQIGRTLLVLSGAVVTLTTLLARL